MLHLNSHSLHIYSRAGEPFASGPKILGTALWRLLLTLYAKGVGAVGPKVVLLHLSKWPVVGKRFLPPWRRAI